MESTSSGGHRRACGMGDIVVDIFGKNSMPHCTFSACHIIGTNKYLLNIKNYARYFHKYLSHIISFTIQCNACYQSLFTVEKIET